jgi:ubiquinone/menaquinone biosynthesis C-methylase UbiE
MRTQMNKWDKILHEEWYSQEKPDETVIDFASLLTKKKKMRVLDLGCGAGRHQVYIAKQGFVAHGIDFSETGLNLTKERLKKQKLEVNLAKCDMKMLPYISAYFDAVISLHTIYHQKTVGIQRTISQIHRILKRNGFLLMNFLSKRTYSYGKGTKVEKDTFVEQEGIEKGVLHHFTDRDEIERLLENFKIINLKLREKEVEGKLRSRWIVIARK